MALHLDLDTHIQGNARALLTGEASPTDRFMVRTEGYKRMKRTRADGVPIWDDCPVHEVDITEHVRAEAARLREVQR